jgi:MoxR-like ATPase
VLLVGPVGVGKTQTFLELARRKRQFGFIDNQFWETSGSRIVAGMSGFGQWQQRCQKIVEELKKRNGILLVGNLMELLEVGRSNNQSQTVASWMQPHIQRGSLQLIAECTPEQLSIIEQREPQLFSTLTVMRIERPDETLQKKIFGSTMDHLLMRLPRQKSNVLASEDGLDAIYRLHHRYATYSANPGRPLQFMQRLVEDASTEADENDIMEIDAGFVSRAFSAQTGLPEFLLDREQSLDLEDLTGWFSKRVIGQPTPVETVVDLVATVKAGLSPIGKPIASLMFIGPTGVGKTEMAKSLAEFMFSSQQRLLRFDMSEFGDNLSVQRLIGGTGEKEGLLTGKIKQHPFSVVLFDEFEKAHPSFMDLLLQVLGEGRLTDGLGRTTDFSTTIIVITSNLGAEQFKPVSFGFADPAEHPDVSDRRYEDHFVQQVRQRLRPELFNRIDRIVPFRPLQLETVRQIVRREIDKLKRREGIWHRGVEVNISDETCDWLASSSLDLRYGARPIQRLIHDQVTIPLSEKLASFSGHQRVASNVEFDAEEKRIRIQAKGVEAKQHSSKALVTLVREVQQLRRMSHKLSAGDATLRLKNEMYQRMQAADRNSRRMKKLQRRDAIKNANEIELLELENRKLETEIAEYQHFVGKAKQIHQTCCHFEEKQLMRYFDQETIDIETVREECVSFEQDVKKVIFENFLFESKGGHSVTLLIWTPNLQIRKGLVQGYLDFAEKQNLRATGYWLLTHNSKTPDQEVEARLKNETDGVIVYDVHQKPVQQLFNDSAQTVCGIGLKFVGPAAYPMFSYEGGRHLFKNVNTRDAVVEVIGGKLAEHELSDEVLSSGPYDGVTLQRTYNFQRHLVEDVVTQKHPFAENTSIRNIVSMCVEKALQHHLDKYIE